MIDFHLQQLLKLQFLISKLNWPIFVSRIGVQRRQQIKMWKETTLLLKLVSYKLCIYHEAVANLVGFIFYFLNVATSKRSSKRKAKNVYTHWTFYHTSSIFTDLYYIKEKRKREILDLWFFITNGRLFFNVPQKVICLFIRFNSNRWPSKTHMIILQQLFLVKFISGLWNNKANAPSSK